MVPFAGGVPKSTLRATAKLAVHVVLALMVMVHVGLLPQDAQSPPQPTKTYPASGVAVSVTKLPSTKFAEQSEPPEPQLIPGGVEVMVPFVGGVEMERLRPKLAVHALLEVIVMMHVVLLPQDAQSPPQLTKT